MKPYKAQNLAEFGIIVLTVAVLCMGILMALGPSIRGVWSQISTALDKSECERASKTWDVGNSTCS